MASTDELEPMKNRHSLTLCKPWGLESCNGSRTHDDLQTRVSRTSIRALGAGAYRKPQIANVSCFMCFGHCAERHVFVHSRGPKHVKHETSSVEGAANSLDSRRAENALTPNVAPACETHASTALLPKRSAVVRIEAKKRVRAEGIIKASAAEPAVRIR